MKNVVLIPIGGLCNRIRFICSSYEFMEKWAKIYVIWLQTDECNIKMENLFSLPYDIKVVNYDITGKGGRKYIYLILKLIITHSRRFISQLDFSHSTKGNSEEMAAEFKEKFTKHTMFCAGCEKIKETYSTEIMKPTDEIQKMVQENIKDYPDYVSMHIRRTDFYEAIKRSPVKSFEKYIESEIRNGNKIYLATDDKDLKEKLVQKYKPYIYTQDVSSFSRNDGVGIREAYVDLLCLSKGKREYGSFGSSFSEVASVIGGIELITVTDT